MSGRSQSITKQALELYLQGFFPMAEEGEIDSGGVREIEWLQPRVRGLLPLDDRFHVPRSLQRTIRRRVFEVTSDEAFGRVIRECARPSPGRETTWLEPRIIRLFDALHAEGHAHSIEAWRVHHGVRTLVGGTYGLTLGRAWCGESMFSRPEVGGTDASKVCLVHLVHHLRDLGFTLFDAQLSNPHLLQFGLFEVPAADYLQKLSRCQQGTKPRWRAMLM
jgi:leucyl/phenylalanyl-tRNA---protein transferase